jgi:NADH:ubiquinone oxidoreductase subunit F (NADH-binding)/NADH:ubiquinone oxidoreductase subunit E/NAD-dependent dihydropyrimidine dehydrogenase PreA subunit
MEGIVASVGRRAEDLIPLLQAIQKHYNYLPASALERLCELTEITPDAVSGVSTFYSQFRHYPVGKHVIKTCTGTACHVNGANTLHDTFRQQLKIKPGEHTDPEGEFTVEEVACLGCCMLAPVAQIDEVIYGQIETWKVPELIEDFLAADKSRPNGGGGNGELLSARDTVGEVRICLCSSCVAGGSKAVYDEVMQQAFALDLPVTVKDVGCTGLSYETPLLEVQLYNENRYRYGKVDPVDVRDLLLRHFRPTSWLKRVGARVFHGLETFFTDESWVPPTRYSQDVRHGVEKAYVGSQVRLVTEHAGVLDPRSIEDYLAHDGFKAMELVLKQRQPEEVIAEVKTSGLRGRGGAGFPTGMKWEFTRAAKGDQKYIICNGDEGDPGAFMDRMILESFPYRVLEGMVICAFAVGASEGFLYIRAEYPLATTRIREAIQVCEKRGLLGENIMGTGFSLKLRVVEGAGAFVCGEETALMSAIEGGRGMPRFRPPFPAQSGLWGKPTCINNVESFASVPWILRNGAKAYSAYGTEKSKGTKTFALAGKVRRGGLIEVPMGMTIHEIVNDIGGGVPEGRKLKAVLMGGPSGGCVPAHLAHTPVDYEALKSVGAIMGSGGMVVLDDSDCIVDVARYFLAFTQDESCGKCTHCRIGTKRMKEILDRLCMGKGRKGDLEMLEVLSGITIEGSLCGLGKTAPNPVLSSLRYYRDEYEAHVRGECPSRKCKSLVQYFITDTCFGCTRCAQMCPTDSIPMNPYHHHVIEESTCTRCDICKQVCPVNAIEVIAL